MSEFTPEAGPPPERIGGADGDREHLGRLINESAFAMHFQPIVDLRSRAIFAYEALCRPLDGHFESPIALIRAAVEAERIGELGRLQRTKAVKGCAGNALFLNLEPHEFDQPWLVRPDDPIFKHRFPVYLEITENVPLKYFDQCHSILRELRKKGTLLVIDDFGAGFSNLKYIAELEPDIVKLDRELVRGCEVGTSAASLLSSITALCHEMRAQVVAEGIETIRELETVLAAGVDFGQGYLLARPGPEPGATRLLMSDWPPNRLAEPDQIARSHGVEGPRTTLREDELVTEIARLNELLLESEAGRLSLVKKLREQSHAPAPAPENETASGPDAGPIEPPAVELLGTSSFAPSIASDRLLRALGYAAMPLLFGLIIALWFLWPSADHGDLVQDGIESQPTPVFSDSAISPEAHDVDPMSSSSSIQGPMIASAEELPPTTTGQPAPPTNAGSDLLQTTNQRVAEEIQERVAGWARAWSDQLVQKYISYYSPDFEPASGAAFRDWVHLRRQRIEAPEWIKVEIADLEITVLQPDLATAQFSQTYSSPGYRDRVDKTLEWTRQGEAWRILAERAGLE